MPEVATNHTHLIKPVSFKDVRIRTSLSNAETELLVQLSTLHTTLNTTDTLNVNNTGIGLLFVV